MEQSPSTCALLPSTIENQQQPPTNHTSKWLTCLSMKKKITGRSLSSSPDFRKENGGSSKKKNNNNNSTSITRSSTIDRRQSGGFDVPRIVAPPSPDFPYFSMTIKPRSTVFLVYADDRIRQTVLSSLANTWGLDARKRRSIGQCDDGAYWIRLRNQPFLDGTGTAARTKLTRAICDCVHRIREHGWMLTASIDLANQYPASTLFFRRINDSSASTSSSMIVEKSPCLTVNGSDTLSLTDANENLIARFRRVCTELYPPGLAKRSPSELEKSSSSAKYNETNESLRLKGQPFFSHDRSECTRARQLILDLIAEFDTQGYRPYGTLNLTCSSDSILFEKKRIEEVDRRRYMCISLMLTNKIRLFDAPPNVVEALRRLCSDGPWEHGMDSCKIEGQRVVRIKFQGHPWNPLAVECHWARRFLCRMFVLLAEMGWRCALGFDLNRHTYNKSNFLFYQCQNDPPAASPPYGVFCLNLSSGCYAQLIDAPPEISRRFSEIAHRAWPKPVIDEPRELEGVHDWTLRMSPWSWGKLYDAHGRALIGLFIEECSRLGYRVMTGANILTKYDMPNEPYPRDAHCVFFEFVGEV